MSLRRAATLAVMLAWMSGSAMADDNALLIQTQPDGSYKVWHTEGPTELSDDELLALDAAASPDGSMPVPTAVGLANAMTTPTGVLVFLQAVKRDRTQLIDRDGCGHLKAWHSEGETKLTEEQITDLVLAAVPGGGARVPLGDKVARSFTVPLGVTVTIWRPIKRAK